MNNISTIRIVTGNNSDTAISIKLSMILFKLIEQGLTSHQKHYRSYRGQVLWVKRSNQHCQSTEGREVLRTRLQFH